MGLMDKLLKRAPTPNNRSEADSALCVDARVRIAPSGEVQYVVLLNSSGCADKDAEATAALYALRFPRNRIGPQTTDRWHHLRYTFPP